MKLTTFCSNAASVLKRGIVLMAFLIMLGLAAPAAHAQSTFDLKASGSIQVARSGISTLAVSGTGTLLSQFTCHGELQFTPSSWQTGALEGNGVAVFRDSYGNQLVGLVTLKTSSSGAGQIAFSWRESVLLGNGTTVRSTGRFQTELPADTTTKTKTPPGPVVIAIIAVLIG